MATGKVTRKIDPAKATWQGTDALTQHSVSFALVDVKGMTQALIDSLPMNVVWLTLKGVNCVAGDPMNTCDLEKTTPVAAGQAKVDVLLAGGMVSERSGGDPVETILQGWIITEVSASLGLTKTDAKDAIKTAGQEGAYEMVTAAKAKSAGLKGKDAADYVALSWVALIDKATAEAKRQAELAGSLIVSADDVAAQLEAMRAVA